MAESYCLPCIYYGKTTNTCDYILIEDQCRPCPGGKGCTARRMKKDVKKVMGKPKWDTELGMQMWLEGKKDKEIAEHFGIAANTVTTCRRKYWEKHKQPPKKNTEEATDPMDPPVGPVRKTEPAMVSMSTPDGVYRILEEATKTKSGIEAICTADAILCLWNWESADDLRRARAAINHLIKRLEG